MDGEGDREGALLICDGGQLCEEILQRGQDGLGLTPVSNYGMLGNEVPPNQSWRSQELMFESQQDVK